MAQLQIPAKTYPFAQARAVSVCWDPNANRTAPAGQCHAGHSPLAEETDVCLTVQAKYFSKRIKLPKHKKVEMLIF